MDVKESSENLNKIDGKSSFHNELSSTSNMGTFQSTDKEKQLQDQKNDEISTECSARTGFGLDASGEFICISCGDDFDCKEDLMSHQEECGESAKMVGSGGGDSLKEGLGLGGRKVGDGSRRGKYNDGFDLRKCDVTEDGDGEFECEGNIEKLTSGSKRGRLYDDKTEGSINVHKIIVESKENEDSVSSVGGGSVERKDGDENISESLTDSEKGKAVMEDGEAHMTGTNDDNNNDIHRHEDRFHKDKGTIPSGDDGDLDKVPVSEMGDGDCSRKKLSLPDILSTSLSNVHSMENHFRTQKLTDVQGLLGNHRYSSSSAGLSSNVVMSSSSSSSSLRPKHRCQICGRSFWEGKQLSQHWAIDHGIKSTKLGIEDDNNDEESLLTSVSPHGQSKPKSVKSSLKVDNQAEDVSRFPVSSWPLASNYLGGQGSMAESLFTPGSAFRDVKKIGLEDTVERLSSQRTNHRKLHGDIRRTGISIGKDSLEGDVRVVNGRQQEEFDTSGNEKRNVEEKMQTHAMNEWSKDFQESKENFSSITKQEGTHVKQEVVGSLDSHHLLNPGNFVSASNHLGMASNEFLSTYLSHYNKLAQWCLAQGPNFCPTCFVYHSSDSPCPRLSETGLSSGKHQPSHLSTNNGGMVKKEEAVEMAEDQEEDKDINVDGDEEEMEEGPLDMSRSALECSAPNSNSSTIVSLSSLSSTKNPYVSPIAGHHHHHHPHLDDNAPSSTATSSSSTIAIPPYYSYSHFLRGNSVLDMSAAMQAAVGGNLADLLPQPSSIQDLAAAAHAGLAARDPLHQNFNSYLHHHPLSAAAIAAQSSLATNSNNGTTASAMFSKIARPHNSLNGGGVMGLISSHDISSASSPSSIFSFPSSPPNPNTASTCMSTTSSISSASSSTSHLPPPSTSIGKKKSTPIPPKQGFPCTVCNRVYSHQSALFTHMRTHSPSGRSYRCQFCHQTFARAPDLKVHVCPNGVEKPFTCPSCGQTFAKNIHLKRHLATHSGLKPYPCWVCGKRFSRSDHLKRHTQSIHAGARPHVCNICGKEFVRKYELNKHMTSHA